MLRRVAHPSRVLAPAVFALAAAAFLLPFLTVEQERVASATGLELVRGEAEVSGRYVHAAYEGEVERRINRGRPPATIAFSAAIVGVLVSWSRNRVARIAAFVVALVGFLAALALLQTTSSPFNELERHEGVWLSIGLLLSALVLATVRAFTNPPAAELAEGPPWLRL